MTTTELKKITDYYNITFDSITKEIDSTNQNDYRLNLILDNKYVVRINNTKAITEERLAGIERLICRYNDIGVYAPHYLKNKDGRYSFPYEDKICYISEYADFPLADETELHSDDLEKEVLHHLGVLAAKYSNCDLVPERSMWSIIDLAPLDVDIDEKQENLNTLTNALTEIGEVALANQLCAFNRSNREKILQVFDKLPRCVFQGDLNDSNILLKDGHFHGLIDFNMSGTEVNINCFLCETNRGLLEGDFDKYSPEELLNEMLSSQNDHLRIVFENYTLNDFETQVFENYRNIILISQYPNVCDYIYFLNTVHKAKVLELLHLIVERPFVIQ